MIRISELLKRIKKIWKLFLNELAYAQSKENIKNIKKNHAFK